MAEQIKNSDILYLYDAKMCNPNGDPDDENKPRMDYETETNLVSDVRLKRYIRDYLEDKENLIFVAKVDGKTVDATQRLEDWLIKGKIEKKSKTEIEQELLQNFIDIRLFGITLPRKKGKGEEKGESFTFTGPVQFNWGYSLNKVSIVESSTISSTFAGRTKEGENEEYGTFGKDWRVYYSLLAFHGIISGKRAEHTNLSDNDIKLLEEALIKAIPLQATRSKIDQYPRLLIRVELTDTEKFIGDLRRYVKAKPIDIPENKIRDVSHLKLNMDELLKELNSSKDKIDKIYYWQDKALTPQFAELVKQNEELEKKLQPIEIKD